MQGILRVFDKSVFYRLKVIFRSEAVKWLPKAGWRGGEMDTHLFPGTQTYKLSDGW